MSAKGAIHRTLTNVTSMPQGMVQVSADGRELSFDPKSGFIVFPGGAKKFTIRYDAKSRLYWSQATLVPRQYQGGFRPGTMRNTLALICSADSAHWTVRRTLLHHTDLERHGFQYADWLFEGDGIISACRTAYDDGYGGARDNHDSNFLTLHRVVDFRAECKLEKPCGTK